MQTGTTTASVNLRAGPGTQHPVVLVLPPRTPVVVVSREGDWLQVSALGRQGYVHSKFVLLADQGVPDGFLGTPVEPSSPAAPRPSPALGTPAAGPFDGVPLEPSAAQRITLGPGASATQKLVAGTWNRLGGLLGTLADKLRFDPGVAVAVLVVESSGRGFAPDGRMIIRFENHVFYDRWGKDNQEEFDQHFRFRPNKRWLDHRWRSFSNRPWQEFHGNQSLEWNVFEFAQSLNRVGAMLSISMGGPQIMGFNYATVGFESVQQMFDAFSASERDQIVGFFDFVQGPSTSSRRVLALQALEFDAFASLYNGPGQAPKYGSLIKTAFETFRSLTSA